MKALNRSLLTGDDKVRSDEALQSPIRVLQIGEGNFLRGFADWMIQTCRNQGLFDGAIAVVQPRPSGKAKIDKLAGQDGVYTLVTRGLEDGKTVERKEIVSVFSEAFDPYSEWEKLVRIAVSPDLKIVFSNTTEAGLVYRPEPLPAAGGAIESFPGKIAFLLHARFEALRDAAGSGLLFLPCELLDRNGDALRDAVLRYADDWGYSQAFKDWVVKRNRFLNSLVDRIVTGYPPEEQAEAWFSEWGYRDDLLVTAEPYHLWAIEGGPEWEDVLPFRKAGLNVHWTNDLSAFQLRKVRILNGAHTWMTPLGLLHGVETVGELLQHPELGAAVRDAVYRSIVPSLPGPSAEVTAYADSVFERFANPFIRHRLADIAMNSLSKFKTRLLPTLASYADRGEPLPDLLLRGWAGLLRYYRVKRREDGSFEGTSLGGVPYKVRDDAAALERIASVWEESASEEQAIRGLLADEALWGRDLNVWNGAAEALAGIIREWN
ncbi:tagaturonate reductase [Cohnella caldifontis]|uniref:tagaturonate reductase n=1 Tax=Cohnella caldifontis TaxID=3027471 RepID=UPI0023EA7A79|nr:tagaturonate reductase [Cohnella sp. YIM B05605]